MLLPPIVDLAKISGSAARSIIHNLRPFMKGIDAGQITLRFSNALRKGLKEKNN
jgi:hypothetical protein